MDRFSNLCSATDVPPSPRRHLLLAMIDVIGPVHKAAQGSGLAEERIELPKHLLLPLVKRVIVTLRALHLLAEEDSGRATGRQDAFFRVNFVDQEIDSTVEILGSRFGGTSGGHQFVDQSVVRLVAGE